MAAGPIGSCWATGSWLDTAWEEDTWAGVASPVVYSTAPSGVVPDDYGTEVQADDWSTAVQPDDWSTDVIPDSASIIRMKNGATNTLSGTLTMADPSLYPDWTGATGEIAIKAVGTGAVLQDYTALDDLDTDTLRYSYVPSGVSFPDGSVEYDFRVTFTSVSPNVIAYFPDSRNVPAQVMSPVGTP